MDANIALLLFIFVLTLFLGFELISKIPSRLHTPLMSATNAISGIILIGALYLCSQVDVMDNWLTASLVFIALFLAAFNVFGGYIVTDRILKMFKHSQHDKAKNKKGG